MVSVFWYFEPYFSSASLMSKVLKSRWRRNGRKGSVSESAALRDARRLRVSLFPAAAEERRLLGFSCLPRCSRLGFPSLPQPQVAW